MYRTRATSTRYPCRGTPRPHSSILTGRHHKACTVRSTSGIARTVRNKKHYCPGSRRRRVAFIRDRRDRKHSRFLHSETSPADRDGARTFLIITARVGNLRLIRTVVANYNCNRRVRRSFLRRGRRRISVAYIYIYLLFRGAMTRPMRHDADGTKEKRKTRREREEQRRQ